MQKVSVAHAGNMLVMKNRTCEIEIDLATGTWSGKDRASGLWAFKDAVFRIDKGLGQPWSEPETVIEWEQREINSCFGAGTEVILKFTPQEGYDPIRMLYIRLYSEHPFVEIGWGVQNQFDYPVRVQNVEVVYGGEVFREQRVMQPRVLKSGAGAEPNPVVKDWQTEAFNGAMLTYKDGAARRT
ncbi:MAG: hypothetical protein R6V56_08380, partial [Lentisphaeria bacterium]